jgi:hypothetical protein
MARFLGATSSKGDGRTDSIIPTTSYTRATGITTDANNNVTSVTLGDASYSSILYGNISGNSVGLITSYTETISGTAKNFILTYNDSSAVTAITQVS